ncbi:MAG: cytochrome P450 [Acaryochloris sp. RU_4_1]|nr:cytochrome P450 [Acaryochloris sp. RU_4_1]
MLIGLLLTFGIALAFSLTGYQFYFRLVGHLSSQVNNQNAEGLPGEPPKFLVGNMLEVYQSPNQLSAYHRFHEQFGEIVQIFWMWRLQVSTASYQMAQHILVSDQRKYKKYPPNSILKKLYGSSILTNEGEAWQRQRLLMQQVFSKKKIGNFHDIFISHSEKLVSKWSAQFDLLNEPVTINIYPDLLNVFLDIIGHAVIDHQFGALEGKTDDVLKHVNYLLSQSTKPQHQFTSWWKYVPIPSNLRLFQAFTVVDDFIHSLIHERREKLQQSEADAFNILDLLLTTTELSEGRKIQLTDQEVRDNLLAII